MWPSEVAYVMMTAPGREELLAASVRSLDVQPIVVIDEGSNPTLNHARALELGAQIGKWVVAFEDDICAIGGFCRASIDWLREHARENRRLYAFYSARPEVRDAVGGEWNCPIGWFYGTQCYAVRSADAVAIARHLRSPANLMPPSQYDLAIAIWHLQAYPTIEAVLCSAPSFVQHVGFSSSIKSPFHQSPSFDPSFRYRARSAAA